MAGCGVSGVKVALGNQRNDAIALGFHPFGTVGDGGLVVLHPFFKLGRSAAESGGRLGVAATAPFIVTEKVEIRGVVRRHLAEFDGEVDRRAEVGAFRANRQQGVERDGTLRVFFDQCEQAVFRGFLVGRGGAKLIVTASAEERCENGRLQVVGELSGNFAKRIRGSSRSFFDVFDQAVTIPALQFGAFSLIHQIEQAGGDGDAGRVRLGRWGEHRHQHAPMGQQTLRILPHGSGEMAARLELPAAVDVVHALVHMGLRLVGGGGDGHLDAVGEIHHGGFAEGFDRTGDRRFHVWEFIRGGNRRCIRLNNDSFGFPRLVRRRHDLGFHRSLGGRGLARGEGASEQKRRNQPYFHGRKMPTDRPHHQEK